MTRFTNWSGHLDSVIDEKGNRTPTSILFHSDGMQILKNKYQIQQACSAWGTTLPQQQEL